MDLTPDIVFALIQSTEDFPVDFDDAMKWWDARTRSGKMVAKGDLKDKLEDNFIRDADYLITDVERGLSFSEISEKPLGGRPKLVIRMTVECFKMMGMMIPGSRGRQIRQYFVACEAELKRRLEEDKQDFQGRIVRAFVSDKVVSRRPRFKDEFYELLYQKRGQGWESRSPKKRPPCVGSWTNQLVYDRFPNGVKERLNEVNPRVDGRRKDKHHEHLKPMGSDHLDTYLPAVMAIARLSPDGDWDKFMRNVQRGLPNGEPIQTSLLDLLDDYEQIDQAS